MRWTLRRRMLVLGCLAVLISAVVTSYENLQHWLSNSSTNTLVLAVVGPMTGPEADKGLAMVRGAELFVKQYNQQRLDSQIALSVQQYDDANNIAKAEQIANQFVNSSNVIAVLGHRDSDTSVEAAKIYQRIGMPMIGASATAPEITQNNDWAFRVIPDNKLQGRFVADYIASLAKDKVVMIFSNDKFGVSLADAFLARTDLFGIETKPFMVEPSSNIEKQAHKISREISQFGHTGAVFLAVGDVQGEVLVSQLKHQHPNWTFIGSSSIGKQSFPERFKQRSQEQEVSGYFTNGMLAVSPMLFDVASESTQLFYRNFHQDFGYEPSGVSAAYFDATTIASAALSAAIVDVGGTELFSQKSISSQRAAVKNKLASFNSQSASVRGLTHSLYFDHQGNVQRPMQVGLFSGGAFVSAPLQLQISPESQLSTRRTDVVYTGVEMQSINQFSTLDMTFQAKFKIWFRNTPGVKAEDIVFLNSVGELVLSKPIESSYTSLSTYQLYQVEGTFIADAKPGRAAFGEYQLGVSFRHKTLPRSELIYVSDIVGLGQTSLHKNVKNQHKVQFDNSQWRQKASLSFQDTLRKRSLGDPKYLHSDRQAVEFSRFNSVTPVYENALSLRGRIPAQWQQIIFYTSVLAWLLYALVLDFKLLGQLSRAYGLGNKLLYALFIASAEPLFLDWLAQAYPNTNQSFASNCFDVLWWLLFASTLALLVDVLLWDPIERRSGRQVPKIMRHFTRGITYIGAVFAILSFVYQRELTSLLATSGLVAMILGLALQSNLVNIFSGIAISLEKPFKLGDWISLGSSGGPIVGEVIDMNWRTTKVKTADNTLYSIPNNTLANANLNNVSSSGQIVTGGFSMSVSKEIEPLNVIPKIEAALIAIDAVKRVYTDVSNIGFDTVDYQMKLVHGVDDTAQTTDLVWQAIWRLDSELKKELSGNSLLIDNQTAEQG
ncbi:MULTISPECIES: ABC transporter substrate-binding protein [unclassified Agarivorans]|uniref:ABC transporter substrate-binding protein n=1 Tax=unclassified Agarivorans TaxID=2636026 RepID=UPI0026E204BA|nr:MULTISPECIES: ABC transporter substrate-binding protein [unclassified Agarivorans]MDO6686079.1 mechanosensitive ion channel [Agarivorans sp. 3_MG-2023]MDO6713783.1 mechanosensitive ion channel [Agarivorans sp. 2_MG-2023]